MYRWLKLLHLLFIIGERELMEKMSKSFEKVSALESEMLSECKHTKVYMD